MLLNIYLGTTAVNWIITILSSVACKNKLKREGYKFKKENKSILEKILDYISVAFLLSIPVFNIISGVLILCMKDKFYESSEDSLLKKGKIYKPLEMAREMTREEKIACLKDLKNKLQIEQEQNTSQYNPNNQKDKKIEEMTREEKIACLKNKLQIEQEQNTSQYNPNNQKDKKTEEMTREEKIACLKDLIEELQYPPYPPSHKAGQYNERYKKFKM